MFLIIYVSNIKISCHLFKGGLKVEMPMNLKVSFEQILVVG